MIQLRLARVRVVIPTQRKTTAHSSSRGILAIVSALRACVLERGAAGAPLSR